MNTANTKAVTVELITTCWAPLISCPCQQDLPSAKHYPYTCTASNHFTSTFAGCLGAGNTGHICMCLYVSDINVFFWEHISSHLLRLPFFAGSLLWFEHDLNIFQFWAKGAFGVHSYDMIKNVPPDAIFIHKAENQNWVSPKLDGLRWFNLVLKPYSQLWLHGVSLYFNLESGLSLASGWNLCSAAISFIASHLSFPSVVDLLCLIGQFHIMAIFHWDDVVRQKIVTWPLVSKP